MSLQPSAGMTATETSLGFTTCRHIFFALARDCGKWSWTAGANAEGLWETTLTVVNLILPNINWTDCSEWRLFWAYGMR